MAKTVGTWKCRMGIHLWPVLNWGAPVEYCARCGARKIRSW